MSNEEKRETLAFKIKKRGWKFVAAYLAIKWSVWGAAFLLGRKIFLDNQ